MTGREGREGGAKQGLKPRGSLSQDLRTSAQLSREWKTALRLGSPGLSLTPRRASQSAAAKPRRPAAPSAPLPGARRPPGGEGGRGQDPAQPGSAGQAGSAGRERRPGPGERGVGGAAFQSRALPPPAPQSGPPLPVVAVISERCEVLLQLPVRLLEPLAQVLELAAERGLEGRVLGVHARAAPAGAGRRRPREPRRPLLPPLRPLYRFLRPLSPPSCGDRGRRRGGTEGEVGGGAEEGGARRAQGASATTLGGGPREGGDGGPRPAEGGLRRGGRRAHQPPPSEGGEGEGGLGVAEPSTRSSAAQDKNAKGRPCYCSCWEREETGQGNRKEHGAWGRTESPFSLGRSKAGAGSRVQHHGQLPECFSFFLGSP